jgi:hypothetical protein
MSTDKSISTPPVEAVELRERLSTLFMSRPDLPISNQWLPLIEQALQTEITKARIEELEIFQWNDSHMYIHNRLAELRGDGDD